MKNVACICMMHKYMLSSLSCFRKWRALWFVSFLTKIYKQNWQYVFLILNGGWTLDILIALFSCLFHDQLWRCFYRYLYENTNDNAWNGHSGTWLTLIDYHALYRGHPTLTLGLFKFWWTLMRVLARWLRLEATTDHSYHITSVLQLFSFRWLWEIWAPFDEKSVWIPYKKLQTFDFRGGLEFWVSLFNSTPELFWANADNGFVFFSRKPWRVRENLGRISSDPASILW